MKKNFVKKLALGLALVMAVTSVPASSEAAAAPGFKSDAVKVRVGQTKKYSTENAKKYSVKFKIGNKKVATIKYTAGSKSVKVTGVAEGKTTLRADFKSYKTKKVTTAKVPVTVLAAKAETPVVEEATLVSVKQTAANAFEATFTTDAKAKVNAESFTSIVSQGTGYTATVNTVEWSADGKTAYVTTFGNFVDKAVYDVTCNGKTASFTASIGEVASIVIDTLNAKAGVPTDIEFRLFDAAGIDVTNVISLNTNVIVSVTGDYSYVETARASEATITMATAGDKAEVTVTYSKFDGTNDVTKTAIITCVDNTVVVGAKEYFTVKTSAATPKFYLNSYKANTTVYMDEAATAFFLATDAKENGIAYDAFEVESSNEAVLEVSEGTYDVDGKVLKFNVEPVSTGTAQITIKATKNDKTYTYTKAVTVKPAKVATTIALSSASTSMSEAQTTWVGAYVLDQYGKPMSLNITAEDVTNTSVSDDVDVTLYDPYHMALRLVGTRDVDGDRDGVDDDGVFTKIGTHVIELSASDAYGNEVTKKFSVNVKNIPTATSNNVDYKLVVTSKTIDLNPEENCASCYYAGGSALDELNTTVKLAQYVGGVFAGYVTKVGSSDVMVEVKKGSKVLDKDLTTTGSAIKLADETGAITYNVVTNPAATTVDMLDDMAATGTYNVIAEYTNANGKLVKKSATFTVKNTMEMPTVKAVSTVATSNGTIIDECLLTDVSVTGQDGNEAIHDLGYYYAATNTFVGVNADGLDFDANGRLLINRVLVKDTFNGVTYTYYVPFTRTFKQD